MEYRWPFLVLLAVCVAPSVHAIEGWAVIVEMNEFPEPYGDIPVNYLNSGRLTELLLSQGWKEGQINRSKGAIFSEDIESLLGWLEEKSGKDDILIFYIFTHGGWMSKVLEWNEWFPEAWMDLNASRKLLIVDTCNSGSYIQNLSRVPEGHISISGCSRGEVEWAGLEEEGLPIIGSVWNFYLTSAFLNQSADNNSDGYVSVEEAQRWASEETRAYMADMVFSDPDFLDLYHQEGIYPERMEGYPNPLIFDNYGGELVLALDYYVSQSVDWVVLVILLLMAILGTWPSILSPESFRG